MYNIAIVDIERSGTAQVGRPRRDKSKRRTNPAPPQEIHAHSLWVRTNAMGHVHSRPIRRGISAYTFDLYYNTLKVPCALIAVMPIQDRTNEFRTCVESIRNRSATRPRGSEAKQHLLQPNGKPGNKSEFSRMASAIGKDISSTTLKLGKLAQRESWRLTPAASLNPVVQLQSEKLCSTIGQWKSVCVWISFPIHDVDAPVMRSVLLRNSRSSSSKTLPASISKLLPSSPTSNNGTHRGQPSRSKASR